MNGTEFEQITAFWPPSSMVASPPPARRWGDGSILAARHGIGKRLGVRLMERTTRRLALTEAGEAFHQRMRGALQALREIEQDTAAAAAGVRGTLRIALPATFGRMWVAPILPAFLAAYPDLVVETAFEDRYVDLIAESFDVAVRIGTLTDSRLVARRLAPSRRMLCASPAYLQAHGTPVRPADLAQHACLGFSRLASHPLWHLRDGDKATAIGSQARWSRTMRKASYKQPFPVQASQWCPTGWPARNCAVAGWCRCCLTIPWRTTRRSTWSHPSARLVPAKTRAFVDWVTAQLDPRPWSSLGSD